jgi:hypothetical protein
MFNVVSDQLKVAQGWVRCGQCAVVFDASLHFQIERAPETDLAVSCVESDAVPVTPASVVDFATDTNLLSASLEVPEALDSFYVKEVSVALEKTNKSLTEEPPLDMPVASVLQTNAYSSDDVPDGATKEATKEVSFVRDARRQAFWRRPLVRMLLVLFALLLMGFLALQLVVQQRNMLAAMEPKLKPVLQTVCELLACSVEPVRQIEAIVIDSSSFNKINDALYRLSFTIKSTAVTAVAMPSLEVTLTDTQDQAVIRRVLTPVEFGMASSLLGASAEFSGVLTLQLLPTETGSTTARRIAGYRLLAFYP